MWEYLKVSFSKKCRAVRSGVLSLFWQHVMDDYEIARMGIPTITDGFRLSASLLVTAVVLHFLMQFLPTFASISFWLLFITVAPPSPTPDMHIIWAILTTMAFNVSVDIGVIAIMFMVLWERRVFSEEILVRLDYLEYLVYRARMYTANLGVIGYNSSTYFPDITTAKITRFVWNVVDVIRNNFIPMYTEIEFLRPSKIGGTLMDRTTEDTTPPSELMPRIEATRWKNTVLLLTGGLLIVVAVARCLSLWVTVLVAIFLVKVNEKGFISLAPEPQIRVKNGIWRVCVRSFGYPVARGIGVCHDGIFYTPYHVVGTAAIYHDGRWYRATYKNQDSDIATWNSTPRFAQASDGDEVVVTTHRDVGSTSYKVKLRVQDMNITFPSVTAPSESGSPVWKVEQKEDGEEVYHLLGLAGRNYSDVSGVNEFTVTPTDVPRMVQSFESDNVTLKALRPGGGKTRYEVPSLVMEHLRKSDKVLVTGPTRVVCAELFSSLKNHVTPDQLGNFVRGYNTGARSNHKVALMAHATLMKFVITGSRNTQAYKAIIIDESHQDDCATKFICAWARKRAEEGVKVYLFSATHEGLMDDSSNHPIEDEKISLRDVDRVVKQEVEEGKRVILFLPTVEGKNGIKSAYSRLKDVTKVIKLSSSTYHTEKQKLPDPEYRLILTTNIAECGINLDADVVVDTATAFDYVQNGNEIVGRTRIISQASRIQRRGRVGRIKPGKYYYVNEAQQHQDLDKATELDAQMFMSGCDWYDGPQPESMPMLTQAQKEAALSKNINPLLSYLIHMKNGKRRMGADLDDMKKEWLSAKTKRDCGRRIGELPCTCSNYTTKYWDDRQHDELLRLLETGEPFIRNIVTKEEE